ncbi:uncharacterized protein A4U43_C10F18180 [Asparagus officinalis]|uniref:Uncharacterized protein n=1 Tax=Asparagus officinalis TaxID=4686 RepID=A0A5P1E5J2_ASPOF|nr:uncharacterized protein A4U43_C10F18180 [Asparagus officinalis]
MNNYGDEASPWCSFHPKEVVVGVCALCLRERLINLALEQENFHISKDSNRSFRFLRRRASISLPKVFALSSLLHRLESRRQRSDDDSSDQGSIASLEDSFISIKFEDNGQASWESKKQEITDHMPKESSREKSVVEHDAVLTSGGHLLGASVVIFGAEVAFNSKAKITVLYVS